MYNSQQRVVQPQGNPFIDLPDPPPNETPEERAARKAQEAAAKRVSEEIDANLQAELVASRKRKVVRVVILGQAESGKSTLLGHLRMFSIGVSETKQTSFGVQEHHMSFRWGSRSQAYIFYTVGPTQTFNRTHWVTYLDDIDVVILLAPVSCFNEYIPKDSSQRRNRLENSYITWQSICESRLLAKVPLMIILNKCDILKKKLESGVVFRKYCPSYGYRPNDYGNVLMYLGQKFSETFKQFSHRNRSLHICTVS
ncbi:G-protein alpha subunit-domain-containing protein [Gymnopilus junonius]|uniref:G-protein alpha subunit-domain-containing protein n=1 Tax=Gymnopilus junonius TaxID=109634 RepID=A0A9P5NM82_GYMJU|nr:G-protein alpha subunit-domain-containing protein [Gymnopilus junonius]